MGMDRFVHASTAAVVLAASVAAHAGTGRIIVANDEWTLSSTGYSQASASTSQYLVNSVNWLTHFSGGKSVLAYSNNSHAFTGPLIGPNLATAGHSFVLSTSVLLEDFDDYDVIMVSGDNNLGNQAALNAALINFVNAGKAVYLAGGTGEFNGAAGEAAAWQPFLSEFGMSFADTYNGVLPNGGVVPISSAHPVFGGVSGLYQNNGNSIISATGPGAQLLVEHGDHGLYAVWDGQLIPLPTASSMGLAGLLVLGMRRRGR